MIQVNVISELSNEYIVLYYGARYKLTNEDIFFQNSKAYTYLDKLVKRYDTKESDSIWQRTQTAIPWC